MAKRTITGEHKKGFFGSTIGNFFKGGFVSSLIGGALGLGAGLLLTVITGGAAAPLLPLFAIGGAVGGGMLGGSLMAAGGLARWTGETVRNGARAVSGQGGQELGVSQGQGMGLLESLVAVVGAAMGFQSMRNKLVGMFGGGNEAQSSAPVEERGYNPGAPRATAPATPQKPWHHQVLDHAKGEGHFEILEDGRWSVAPEALAVPAFRQALEIEAKTRLAQQQGINPKAMEGIELQPGQDVVFDPAQLLNGQNRTLLSEYGENLQSQAEAVHKGIGSVQKDVSKTESHLGELEAEAQEALFKGNDKRFGKLQDEIGQEQAKLEKLRGQAATAVAGLEAIFHPAAEKPVTGPESASSETLGSEGIDEAWQQVSARMAERVERLEAENPASGRASAPEDQSGPAALPNTSGRARPSSQPDQGIG